MDRFIQNGSQVSKKRNLSHDSGLQPNAILELPENDSKPSRKQNTTSIDLIEPFENIKIEEEKIVYEKNGTEEKNNSTNKAGNTGLDLIACPIEYSKKHPLRHPWSFWYFKNDRSKDWSDNLIKVHNVATVEEFWAVYMHLEDVSKIRIGCDYALFKVGIMPTWEDKENESGGRWLIQLDSRQRYRILDYYWREVLMFLIGNEVENDNINGAVVNVRNKHDKISLWLSTSSPENENQILNTGMQLKTRLDWTESSINFEIHSESQTRKTSSKYAYTI